MDNRFSNLFGLTEDEAIALLDAPLDQVGDGNSRYTGAAHLINFPTERSIQALIRAVNLTDDALHNRIVRRKSIESLGRLKATQAIPVIRGCLPEKDCYTVENAVWALGEIGTQDPEILEEIAQLLTTPNQTYRIIIQTLAKLHYPPALDRIRPFTNHEEGPIASAAIAAMCRLSQDKSHLFKILEFLQHANVYTRRLCIQDLMDTGYAESIPAIAKCPVSLVFRLRGIRTLAPSNPAQPSQAFKSIQPHLEAVIRDHPYSLDLVHEYDQPPTLEFLIRELYETDFGRCYLATQTLIEHHGNTAAPALMETYKAEAHNDYGANYHVIKTLGWLKYAPAYEIFLEGLHRTEPQFQKSRTAAAIALGELGDAQAIPELHCCLASDIWDLKYAALMALSALGDKEGEAIAAQDNDGFIQAKLHPTS